MHHVRDDSRAGRSPTISPCSSGSRQAKIDNRQSELDNPRVATEEEYRRIAFSLPEVTEESYYGSPSFKVGKSFLSPLSEDAETVVVPMNRDERDFRIEQEPQIFHVTQHYANFNMVLVRLDEVDLERLEDLARSAWLLVAKPAVRKRHESMTRTI